jgi:hypothetical protein
MDQYRSFTTNKCNMAFLLLLAAMSLSLVQGRELGVLYSVPNFSLMMHIANQNDANIVFQDRLENALRDHLDHFFSTKMDAETYGHGSVQEVSLSSSIIWREKVEDAQDQVPHDDGGTEGRLVRQYEALADFECQINLNIDDNALSQPIMDLLLIEAFEGENYWYLFHILLSDDILNAIDQLQISVNTIGFRPYDGKDPEYETHESGWSKSTSIGVAAASFFFLILAGMWVYLCLFAKGTLWFRTRPHPWTFLFRTRPHPSASFDKGSVTTDAQSSDPDVDSYCFDDEEESAWMDAWASSITSITMRHPTKPKKQKRVRRPAQRASLRSVLSAIMEGDGDDRSCTSGCEENMAPQKEAGSETNLSHGPTEKSRQKCSALVMYMPTISDMMESQPQYEYRTTTLSQEL